MIFYTYIPTNSVSIFISIYLILNEFSYGKAQIPHRLLAHLSTVLMVSYCDQSMSVVRPQQFALKANSA